MIDEITRLRTEVKFRLIPEGVEPWIRELAARAPAVRESWITTLYLDRPDRMLSRAAIVSPRLNVKVRARRYARPDGTADTPFLWLEVKRRAGSASEKTRLRLHGRLFARFLAGEDLSALALACRDSRQDATDTLQAWDEIRSHLPGPSEPIGAVRFRRRTFEGVQPRVRITVDREITYHAPPADLADPGEPLGGDDAAVVEIKYGRLRPPWIPDLTDGLTPAEHSKFLTLLGHVD